jgi:arginine N-succinyltransferase
VFLLRPARLDDLPEILVLARMLNSLNLPPSEWFLRERIERSVESFERLGAPSVESEYQFVIENGDGRPAGTCAVLSKHGTPEMPHFYLEVGTEERSSRTIGVRAVHVTLKLRKSTEGPTELGALILHPDARGGSGSAGRLLSWGRFSFVGLHRACFEDELIAEMRAHRAALRGGRPEERRRQELHPRPLPTGQDLRVAARSGRGGPPRAGPPRHARRGSYARAGGPGVERPD